MYLVVLEETETWTGSLFLHHCMSLVLGIKDIVDNRITNHMSKLVEKMKFSYKIDKFEQLDVWLNFTWVYHTVSTTGVYT